MKKKNRMQFDERADARGTERRIKEDKAGGGKKEF